jgi:hypothetical protein
MARAKVVHCEDAVIVIFKGDKACPEPVTGVIKFPGGHIEVSRCTDGTYWAHLTVEGRNVIGSRIDFSMPEQAEPTFGTLQDIPHHQDITKIALRVSAPATAVL